MRNIHFINIGCKVNFAETSRLKKMFAELNFEITNSVSNAEIVLINTCTVTNQADSQSRQIIRKIRKNNPNAFIGVLGCYAQLKPSEILASTDANIIFGINEKFKIPSIIDELILENSRKNLVSKIDNSKFDFAFSSDSESRTRAFMKLQDGCDYCCSYCAVPAARGSSRSINFQEILPQILELEKSGYKEIVLSGINLSDYKSENGENFLSLIKFISQLELDIRFRISSIEPQIIDENLVEIIAESSNICPHFHIPLQSGSDRILRLMTRRYNTSQFRKSIEIINNFLPNAFIGLDLISGFPSETVEDFEETKNFINSLKISALHCFTFSKRDGTVAAEMKNQIPKTVKKARTNEILEISNKKQKIFLEQNVGNILNFLPEKFFADEKKSYGHTENYLNVFVETDKKLENKFHKIKIIASEKAALIYNSST